MGKTEMNANNCMQQEAEKAEPLMRGVISPGVYVDYC